MNKGTVGNKLIIGMAVIFALMMVVKPQITEAGSKAAIIIWANSIVPVLLPFFIFSDFIKRSGDLNRLSPRVYTFIIAFMSGYPVGAKVTGDYMRSGELSYGEGKYILSYSLVTGPAFIIFTIGEFIGSREGAIVVAVAHYLGAFMNRWFYKESLTCRVKSSPKFRPISSAGENNLMENFTYGILGGFKAMAVILAYLMVFTIGINFMEMTGIFAVIANETVNSCIKGFMEMTIGINLVGMCDIGIKLKIILASMLVSFGGLSVIGQSASMVRKTDIKVGDIVKIKATHGMIAAILATLIVNFVVL